jgi:hypothetical protein
MMSSPVPTLRFVTTTSQIAPVHSRFRSVGSSDPERWERFFYAYACVKSIGTPDLIIYVRSSWDFLPKAHFPVLPLAWIETVYYVAFLILWVINRLHHRSSGLVIHNLFFVAIFFPLLALVLTGALYVAADSTRGRNHLIYVSEWFTSHINVVLLALSLFFASGVSTVIEKPRIIQTVCLIIDSVIFAGAELLLTAHFMKSIPNGIVELLVLA